MIYYFTAKWCSQCRLMKPIIEQLQKKYDITVIDVDEHKELVENFEIQSLPTIAKGGERLFGIKTKETIIKFLNK